MEVVGTIGLSRASEAIFYIDTYKGNEFANIRKFVKSQKYTGPTKSGVKLNKEQLEIICHALERIPKDFESVLEKDLAKIPISDNWFILVRVGYFNGKYGIDIRLHLKTKEYTGPSKKGIRIPAGYLDDTVGYCRKMLRLLEKPSESKTFAIKQKQTPTLPTVGDKKKNIEGVPNEYHKYF